MNTRGRTDTLRLAAEVTLPDQAQGVLLTVVETGRAILLNYTANQVVADLQRGASRQALVERLIRDYRVEPERAKVDVEECLAALEEEGLLAGE